VLKLTSYPRAFPLAYRLILFPDSALNQYFAEETTPTIYGLNISLTEKISPGGISPLLGDILNPSIYESEASLSS